MRDTSLSEHPHKVSAQIRKVFTGKRLVWLGSLAAILAAAAWLGLRTPNVDRLIANAYTERRVMELRIRDAKYAPIWGERGAAGATLDGPQILLAVNALVSGNLKNSPDSPKWLLAKARAELLALQYEPAIQTLQRLLDYDPHSSQVMIDLASAYYQRAEANSNREVDYGKAIEYLGRALAKSKDDTVALFNRAVCEERLHLYDPALDDWQRYLQIDGSGPWAAEARKRLENVRTKISKKQSSLRRPLLSTAQLSSLVDTAALAGELDGRIEDYLHEAVKDWLPRASTAQPQDPNHAQAALVALAEATQQRHGDLWMADLLAGHRTRNFSSAIYALADAVKATDSGDYAKGSDSAHLARKLFRSAGNLAGELRSQAEEVYASHLLYDGRRCMTLVRSMSSTLRQHQYHWLLAQMSLEEANCAGLLGNLGTMRAAIDRGTREAEGYHYSGLFLRGLGFQADSAASLGDTQEGFSLASRGLDLFWSGQTDLMKGYNFYTDLDTAADILRLPNLQVAVWHQATSLVDVHPDVVQRAMAHRWYGNSAYLANMPDVATSEFAIASRLFSAAPRTEATTRGQMDADIWLAGLEARQGDLEQAAARLLQVQDNLERSPSFGPEIGFYTTQAEVRMRQGDFVASESSLQDAIFLAEWALRSFRSETSRRQWAKQTEQAYRNLVAWKVRQGDTHSALEFWEWYRGAQFRVSDSQAPRSTSELNGTLPPDAHNAPPLQTPTVVAERARLLNDETFVTYAKLSEGVVVWVYDDRGIFFHRITTSSHELEAQAIQFQRLCSTADSDRATVRSLGRTLYDLLIAPIDGHLVAGRALVFEMDDVLSAIPMEALVDHDGRYLAERATVIFSLGLYQTLHVHTISPVNADTPALIVSVPVPGDQGFAPLFDVEREAQTVAEGFRISHWLKGESASLAAIRRHLRGSKVFHFAGHASALPELSGLLLAERDPRTQRARLIDAQSLSPDLVQDLQLAVLSACDTGVPEGASPSGTEGLAQALLRAGVPHVIASRWKVDSAETTQFMRMFYQQLLAGRNVPTALHAAQLAIASEPAFAHPYFWAAFGVQGP